MVVARVRGRRYRSDLYDPCSASVAVSEVLWDKELWVGWCVVERIVLLVLLCDGFMDKSGVLLVSVGKPFANVYGVWVNEFNAEGGCFVCLLVAVGVLLGAYALFYMFLRGVSLNLATFDSVWTTSNNALQQHKYEISMELHFPRFA